LFGKVAGAESKNKSETRLCNGCKKTKEKIIPSSKGDSLLKSHKIPRCNGPTIKWNNISGERIHPGMKLKLTDNTKILYKFGFISNYKTHFYIF
jgi:hypothetical protein